MEINSIEDAGARVTDMLLNGIASQYLEFHEALGKFIHETILNDMQITNDDWQYIQDEEEDGPQYREYYANSSTLYMQILASASVQMRSWSVKK